MLFDATVLIVFPLAMAFACAMDLVTMTIPNRVSLALVAAFAVLAPFAGLAPGVIGLHVGLAVVMLGVGFFLFSMGWIGGGDAKLFAATALWIGPDHIVQYAIVASILGGLLTMLILLLRMMPLPVGLARQEWIARLHDSQTGVPYGIALAAAGLWIYPHTIWMQPLMR